jgi:hypothetical protein
MNAAPFHETLRTEREREMWIDARKRDAEKAYAQALARGAKREGTIFYKAAMEVIEHENAGFMHALARMKHLPVTIDEFIESKEFLGDQMEVWPSLRGDLRGINADVLAGEEPTFEVLAGGATGWGKTAGAHVTQAYQLYLFSCFLEAQRLFGLSPATPLVFMFQSVSTTITRRVIYQPFRNMFLGMPYTRKWVSYDKNKDSSLDLSGNITVVPGLASVQALVGQAIPSAILDEINFMQIIEASKQVPGANGMGGRYDQAEVVYTNISRRRKRSFLTKGPSLGVLWVGSSTRYKGDFLDRRIEEVQEFGEKNITVMRKKQYEARPERYSGEKCRVLIGTEVYPTRVLEEHEESGTHYPENAQVELVPAELETDFRRDPEAAARDYIGIASNAISPFFGQRDRVVQAVLDGRDYNLDPEGWCVKANVDLMVDGMPQIDEAKLPVGDDRSIARYIHVDLSTASDRCGIGIVHVAGHQLVPTEANPDMMESLPVFVVDAAISIKPSATQHLDISAVRQWIVQLVSFWGINVKCVSYDGFQSKESQQILRRAGIATREISVDRGTEGYELFRRSVYDGRCKLPDNELLRLEMITLEHLKDKNKVDHPPAGSKDVSDGVCGAIFLASKDPDIRSGNRTVRSDGTRVRNPAVAQRRQGRVRPEGGRNGRR